MNLDKIKEEARNKMKEVTSLWAYDKIEWENAQKLLDVYIDKASQATRERDIALVESWVDVKKINTIHELDAYERVVKALRNLE